VYSSEKYLFINFSTISIKTPLMHCPGILGKSLGFPHGLWLAGGKSRASIPSAKEAGKDWLLLERITQVASAGMKKLKNFLLHSISLLAY
jgi:hypothetical protein